MDRTTNFNFTWTGFIIAVVLIAMFAGVFGSAISGLKTEYGGTANNSFAKYEAQTTALQSQTDKIRNATDITPDAGLLDIIGGYFQQGYNAIKVSVSSFSLFNAMADDMGEDVPEFNYFKTYIIMIIIVALFLGVLIAALLKYKV